MRNRILLEDFAHKMVEFQHNTGAKVWIIWHKQKAQEELGNDLTQISFIKKLLEENKKLEQSIKQTTESQQAETTSPARLSTSSPAVSQGIHSYAKALN